VNEKEHAYIQMGVEKVYTTFIGRVAEGRHTSTEKIDSIGQGRVWSGNDALKINLVDELGGLDKALAYAAKKAGLVDYHLEQLPKRKDGIAALFKKGEDELEEHIMTKNLGQQYVYLKFVKKLLSQTGIQARLPYELIIE
jgi:protease-4